MDHVVYLDRKARELDNLKMVINPCLYGEQWGVNCPTEK